MKTFSYISLHSLKVLYRWFTATRFRKALSISLSLLTILTSLRFVFTKPEQVLADSLFKLDEGYGSNINDENQSVSSGTITGAVWRTDDLCFDGKCLFFDGNQDYVSFTDDADLDFGAVNSFTITAWVRHAPKTSGTDIIVGKILNSDNDGGYQIQMESDGDITCEIEDADAGLK